MPECPKIVVFSRLLCFVGSKLIHIERHKNKIRIIAYLFFNFSLTVFNQALTSLNSCLTYFCIVPKRKEQGFFHNEVFFVIVANEDSQSAIFHTLSGLRLPIEGRLSFLHWHKKSGTSVPLQSILRISLISFLQSYCIVR